MTTIAIIPAAFDHIAVLADRMRPADLAEVRALGHTPDEALSLSLTFAQEAWTGTVDEQPAVMFGVTNLGLGLGIPWLLGTDLVERHQIAFLRRNRDYVNGLGFPLLRNHVDVRNTVSIRWLRWLGFTIGKPEPWGPFGMMFHPFWRRLNV